MAKAFDKAAKLSPKAQKALAKCLLEQRDLIEDETLWMATFAATQNQLSRWAEDVTKDITVENTEPLDLDRLGALERLAEEALEDLKAGRTTPLDFSHRNDRLVRQM